jgi:hypothetical protein
VNKLHVSCYSGWVESDSCYVAIALSWCITAERRLWFNQPQVLWNHAALFLYACIPVVGGVNSQPADGVRLAIIFEIASEYQISNHVDVYWDQVVGRSSHQYQQWRFLVSNFLLPPNGRLTVMEPEVEPPSLWYSCSNRSHEEQIQLSFSNNSMLLSSKVAYTKICYMT